MLFRRLDADEKWFWLKKLSQNRYCSIKPRVRGNRPDHVLRQTDREAGALRRLPQRPALRQRQRRPRPALALAGDVRRTGPGAAPPAGAVRLRSGLPRRRPPAKPFSTSGPAACRRQASATGSPWRPPPCRCSPSTVRPDRCGGSPTGERARTASASTGCRRRGEHDGPGRRRPGPPSAHGDQNRRRFLRKPPPGREFQTTAASSRPKYPRLWVLGPI